MGLGIVKDQASIQAKTVHVRVHTIRVHEHVLGVHELRKIPSLPGGAIFRVALR